MRLCGFDLDLLRALALVLPLGTCHRAEAMLCRCRVPPMCVPAFWDMHQLSRLAPPHTGCKSAFRGTSSGHPRSAQNAAL